MKKLFTPFMLRYLFSSVTCSILDLALFQLFIMLGERWFGMQHELIYVPCATVIARIISASYNYFVNYFYVFRSRESKAVSATKFLILSILQMLASAGLVTLGCWLFPSFPGIIIAGKEIIKADTIIKCIVDIGLFVAAYFIQKKVIFKQHSE